MFTTDELKRSKLCCVLAETELTRFAEKAADVLSPGEWLIREGEPPWFYILFEGKLRIVKEILGRAQDLFEYEYEIGDFFGETPILLGTQYLVSLRAETHCRVAREFQNLIRKLGDPAERGCSPPRKYRWRSQKATLTSTMSDGTSIRGPITPTNASPEFNPNI